MFEFPINPFSMDTVGRVLILSFIGWVLIWKWMGKYAPSITDTTKKEGTNFLLRIISGIFKR